MMVWGVPSEVKTFLAKPVRGCARPIRHALAAMVLAFLLAPHRRCLKTIARSVLGHRRHVGTISRRLVNPLWKTRDWYVTLYEGFHQAIDRWERRQAGGRRRQWIVAIDTTYHASVSEQMENLIVMSRRKDPARQTTRQHAFLMGLLLTDRGARLPLPRKSYYTEAYCRRHRRRFRTTVQLAAAMLGELRVPEDVDVVVVFDSAFDAGVIHRVCRRRHADNLRVTKTKRRYAVEARPATVSKLGDCLIVASYKENPKVRLQPDQSAEWWAYHQAPVSYRREDRHKPARWHGKVLACTDPRATARQVIEWYEVRWQVELFFRELKSRMQFECYVLMKFEAVERYLDLLLMGLLLLEQQRLRDMQRAGGKVGAVWVQARTTDRLRMLEVLCQRWNVQCLARRLRTPGGTRRVLRDLVRQAPCQVA